MKTISTVKELDALPPGAILRVIAQGNERKHGIACEKSMGRWYSTHLDYPVTAEDLLDEFENRGRNAVFQVLWPHECPQPLPEWERELLDAATEPTVTAAGMAAEHAALIMARDEMRQERDQAIEELRVMRADLAECERQRAKAVEEVARTQDQLELARQQRALLRKQHGKALEDLDEARRLALSDSTAFSYQQAVISHLVSALQELTQ